MVLHLASATDPQWGRAAASAIDEVLLDHAHLEKRAAATALGLTFRYPEHASLLVPLSELAREELAHFELVVRHIRHRGGEFRRLEPSPYAQRLLEVVRRGEPERLIDTLICCAMIEARSCERMQVLAAGLRDRQELDLARMYEGLLACEARHHNTYLDLVRGLELLPGVALRARVTEIAGHEARIVAELPAAPRLHDRAPKVDA